MKNECRVRCYLCNKLGHIRVDYTIRNQRNEQGANCFPVNVLGAAAKVNGKERGAFIDTRCYLGKCISCSIDLRS